MILRNAYVINIGEKLLVNDHEKCSCNFRKMHPGYLAMQRATRLRGPPRRVQLCRKLRQRRVSVPDGEMVHSVDVALQRDQRVRQRGG